MLAYLQLMRLDKPIGSLLLLWSTLSALLLAKNASIFITLIFVLGVVVMRSAGCVVNDYADRHFDAHVERTKLRPLASGKLSAKNALWTLLILLVIALFLLLMLNKLSWLIGCFAVLTALIYPFMKRYTHLPQLILGVAYSWGIVMAYAATVEAFPITCWLLFAANIFWSIAYDTMYAMVDRNDDLKIGVKSTAILFGKYDKFIVALLQIITTSLLATIGIINHLKLIFWICLLGVTLLFIYQQWLIKDRLRENCLNAFLNNNYVGALIFIGILISTRC